MLAVDRDWAFLFALACQLEARGIGLIPCDSIREANRLLNELQPADLSLLVINCRVKSACGFAATMARRSPAVRLLAIVSPGSQCQKCEALHPLPIPEEVAHDGSSLARISALIETLAINGTRRKRVDIPGGSKAIKA